MRGSIKLAIIAIFWQVIVEHHKTFRFISTVLKLFNFIMAATAKNIAILLVNVAIVSAVKVTFYEHANWQGESIVRDYEGLHCYNLPSSFNDKASSISTHDNCFLAFEHSDCRGRMERIAPGTRSHGNLADINFNDMITSFRQCPPSENTCRGSMVVDVDTSEAQDLQQFGQKVKQTMEDWYPFVCRLLYAPGYEEVDRIKLKFDPNMDGVAGADAFGKRITGGAKYYRNNQHDVGSMIHEMAHIIQRYRSGCGWITEGIADYPRRMYYESDRPERPNQNSRFPDPPVFFLNWVDERWPNTLYYVNRDCRDGKYQENIWQRLTGSTAEQLHERMKRETRNN